MRKPREVIRSSLSSKDLNMDLTCLRFGFKLGADLNSPKIVLESKDSAVFASSASPLLSVRKAYFRPSTNKRLSEAKR